MSTKQIIEPDLPAYWPHALPLKRSIVEWLDTLEEPEEIFDGDTFSAATARLPRGGWLLILDRREGIFAFPSVKKPTFESVLWMVDRSRSVE